MEINTVIFDLGGVLIDWNPRYVYRTIFKTEEEIDWFFENVATHDWNENQDAGYPIAKGTVEIFKQLKQIQGFKTYALTNWSAETFHIALERYDFLHWFDGRVVSGEEKTRKPFHIFYEKLLDRYNVKPSQAIFIDDNLRNVKAAEELGIKSIQFHNPRQLKEELIKLGIF